MARDRWSHKVKDGSRPSQQVSAALKQSKAKTVYFCFDFSFFSFVWVWFGLVSTLLFGFVPCLQRLRNVTESVQTRQGIALRAQPNNRLHQKLHLFRCAVRDVGKFAPQAAFARLLVLGNLFDQVGHVVARHAVDLLHQHTLTSPWHRAVVRAPVQQKHRHRVIHTGKPHHRLDVLRVQGLEVNAIKRGARVNVLVKAPANRLQSVLRVDHLARVVEVVAANRRHEGKALGGVHGHV